LCFTFVLPVKKRNQKTILVIIKKVISARTVGVSIIEVGISKMVGIETKCIIDYIHGNGRESIEVKSKQNTTWLFWPDLARR